MIERVTFTGADDSVSPQALAEISGEFPFVEWGILFGPVTDTGFTRFPSQAWIKDLEEVSKEVPMKLSAHWCEPLIWEFVSNGKAFNEIREKNSIPDIFKRTQINTHGMKYMFTPSFIEEIKKHPEMEFILQIDDVNDDFVSSINLPNVSLLQDYSSGSGIFDNYWGHWQNKKYGYSGGLNIDTLPEAMDLWMERPNNSPIAWIDMESGVRSGIPLVLGNKSVFDLQKVEEVLLWVDPYWNANVNIPKTAQDVMNPFRKNKVQHART